MLEPARWWCDFLPRQTGIALGVVTILSGGLFLGCAGSRGVGVPTAGLSADPPEASAADTVFLLPAAWSSTQAIFRLRYSGPAGSATPRLVVRIEEPGRFRFDATELGRKIWSLEVYEGGALSLDHRNRTWCLWRGAVDLGVVPLGPIAPVSLPLLLAGRLPVAAARDVRSGDGQLHFVDSRDRSWDVLLDAAGEPVSWMVREAGEPAFWFRALGPSGGVLSAAEGLQLEWHRRMREALEVALEDSPRPPTGWSENCEVISADA